MNAFDLAWLTALSGWAVENPGLLVGIAVAVPLVLAAAFAALYGPSTGEVGEREPGAAPVAPPEVPVRESEPAAAEPAVAEPVAAEPAAAEPVVPPEPEPAVEPEPEVAEPVAPPVVPAPPTPPAPPAPRVSLRDRLARTQDALIGRLGGLLGGRVVDADLLDELEAVLFTADLGVSTAESLMARVRERASGKDAEQVRVVLREAIQEKLAAVESGDPVTATRARPHVVLVLGVNGSGKTTTIGKLAARFAREGKSVLLGAGDTFRAAAIEQLQVWGERVGCEVVAGVAGGDPAAVAFDTVKAAVARDVDVAIIDTAGRLQTKKPLMEELGKIARVISREIPDAPHESLLVLDSNTGQNAISQAELFTDVTEVSGLVLTKLDGTAKGGVIVGLADRFGIPVKLVGVGEGIDDLRDFSAEEFVDAIFEK